MQQMESLIYRRDQDHDDRPLHCEFATMKQIQDGPQHMADGCSKRLSGMRMERGRNIYFPYFGYSGGENGIFLGCEWPENVKNQNCTTIPIPNKQTRQSLTESTCNYSCSGDFVPKYLSTSCQLNGPSTNVSASWTNMPLCVLKNSVIDGPVRSEDDGQPSWMIPLCVIIVIAVVLLFVLWKYKKKICHPLCKMKDNLYKKKNNVEEGREDLENGQNGDTELQLSQSKREKVGDSVAEETTLLNDKESVHDAANPSMNGAANGRATVTINGSANCAANEGIAELENIEILPHDDCDREWKKKLEGLCNEWKEPLDSNIVETESMLRKDVLSEDGPLCETTLDIILTQDVEYTEHLCYLIEHIPSIPEENTIQGFARELGPEIGFSVRRGVDVFNQCHRDYGTGDTPCMSFLRRMEAYGIKFCRLIDYFTKEDIVKYLLKIHPDCKYCKKLADSKTYS